MPNDRPRLVAITSEIPWPLNSGGHIRSYHLLKAISRMTPVSVLVPTDATRADLPAQLASGNLQVTQIHVGSRSALGEAGRVVRSLVRHEPYAMYGRHGWPAVYDVFANRLETDPPALVYLDHIDAYWYVARALSAGLRVPPVVVDMHNVYSRLLARSGAETRNPALRALLARDAARMEEIERAVAARSAAIMAVSDDEVRYFTAAGARAVHLVPNGVDTRALTHMDAGRSTGAPVVMFLGTMSWGPNAAAVRFLARQAMPIVRQALPDARLLVVGRDCPPDIAALGAADGIEVTGAVPEVQPYLARASVLAVPLEAGGGTRLKILEAFAAGLPVVSTAIGMEGIDARPHEHFVLADREAFAAALITALRDRQAGRVMAEAARQLAISRYDWQDVGAKAAALVVALQG